MYDAMIVFIDLYRKSMYAEVVALKKCKSLGEDIADRLDLPGEALLGSAKLTLTANRRALIENHCGILEYGPEQIQVSVKRGKIVLRGSDLHLEAMNKGELLICGKLQSVEWE